MTRVHLPHLETNLTIACQRRCVSCNHFVPLQLDRVKDSMVTPAQLAVDLAYFTRIAQVDAWAAIGGEPLLHPQLEYLLMTARSYFGGETAIEVWTNGQKLKGNEGYGSMPRSFYAWQIDRLVVSAYPGVLTDGDLGAIAKRCKDAGIDCQIKDERTYPNFTQLLTDRTDDAATLARYRACWFKTYSRVLDRGYFYRCCTSPFIGPLLQGRPEGADGLRIDADTTSADLQRFLDQPEPMESCRVCAGRNTEEAVPVVWGEQSDPAAWIAQSVAGVRR